MTTKVLITGFTGQVGSQLADYLLKETSFDVIGMMRWQEPQDNIRHLSTRINQGDRVSVSYADLNDSGSLLRLLDEFRPDWIFHLAAQSFPKTSFNIPIETLQTNIIGTANLLESILYLQRNATYRPVVHICSSSEVYGKATKAGALTEDTKFHAASPYSLSKIAADHLGQFYGEAYGLRTFVTRMGTHTGARRSDVFFESTVAKQIALIEAGLQDPVLKVGNLNSVRTFQDTRDAVRAYYLLALEMEADRLKPGDVFNIAGSEAFHLEEVIEIFLGMSHRGDIKVCIDPDRLRPIDADYQMFDNAKIQSAINWRPEISARAMFKDLLDHWRAEISATNIPLSR